MEKQRNADLAGYASLLGDSFQSKINLLGQIIKDAHFPSIGQYKERLLSKVISEYIPKKFDVGTGFILFPHKPIKDEVKNPDFDYLNMAYHSISKQCDIIIYDSSEYPVIFKDEDFIVVRPESVLAVIEVKGSINSREVNSILENFSDLGRKIRRCQRFYDSNDDKIKLDIAFYALAWEVYKKPDGKAAIDPTKIRERMATYYRGIESDLLEYIQVNKFFIYDECEITQCHFVKDAETTTARDGYLSYVGRSIRFDEEGIPYYGGDRTISSLLASIHIRVGNFNRYFSYTDETRSPEKYIHYEHSGFSSIVDEYESIDV